MIKNLSWALWTSMIANCGEEAAAPPPPCDTTLTGVWALDLVPASPSCPGLTGADRVEVHAANSQWYLGWRSAPDRGTSSANVVEPYVDDAFPGPGCRVVVAGKWYSYGAVLEVEDHEWIWEIKLYFCVSEEPPEGTFEYSERPGRSSFNDAPRCRATGDLRAGRTP